MVTKKGNNVGPTKLATRAEWLKQFEEPDRALAAKLLNAVRVVSHDEFSNTMTSLIWGKLGNSDGAVALYPERETKKRLGVPHRLFKEVLVRRTTGAGPRRRRASGGAPSPFARPRGDRIEIGSEGVVASLIGQIARHPSNRYVSVPSPSLIRKKRIRHFVVVTDFIGSGDRIVDYLDSAWRVRSIKSWHSAKMLRILVFAYAGTDEGIARTEEHPSQPTIFVARSAPTIDNLFDVVEASAMKAICAKYSKSVSLPPLGHKNSGALLSFKHGCPNNVPPIFFDDTKGWNPIFPGRTTIATSVKAASALGGFDFGLGFSALGTSDYAKSPEFAKLPLENRKLFLYLVALRRKAFSIEEQNDRTGLPLNELVVLRRLAQHHGLIDKTQRLTDIGIGTIDSLKTVFAEPKQKVTNTTRPYYYPKQLRAP